MVDVFTLFPWDVQLSRVPSLPGGQDHSFCSIGSFVCLDVKNAVSLLAARHSFHGAHVEMVLLNNLMPAPHQLLFGGPIQPEFSFGGTAVRLGIDPLTFGKILNRVGNL